MNPSKIQSRIFEIRGMSVMLDSDLAELYGIETKRLKEAVNRNGKRFPADFMIKLNQKEFESLRSQIATSNRGGPRYKPYAFTEQGVAMLASVLNSPQAIKINIAIVRAFVLTRHFALTHKELTDKLEKLESKFDRKFKTVDEALSFLMRKEFKAESQQNRKRIGFRNKET